MEKLERLAARVANDFNRLNPDCAVTCAEELLAAAGRVSELANELAAWHTRPDDDESSDPFACSVDPIGPTVLLVEPALADRVTLLAMLLDARCSVLEAASGVEALQLSEVHPSPVHLLLTNAILPDMSGRELAERAALLRPGMPVVYMSGYTGEEIMSCGLLGSGVATLQKPVTTAALAGILGPLLEPQYA